MSVFFMFKRDPELTLYVLAPLPILAFTIYFVNTIINKKSEASRPLAAILPPMRRSRIQASGS